MLHGLILAAQNNPEAAGFILKGIKGVLVAIGSIIAAIVCAVIAGVKGRNPFGWGILGLFFSILTLIVIAIIPTKKKNQSSGEASRTDNPSGIDVGSLQGDARQVHPETAADSLAMLDERRVNLSHSRTRTVNQLHALLRELMAGGAPTSLTPSRATGALRGFRPRTGPDRIRVGLAKRAHC